MAGNDLKFFTDGEAYERLMGRWSRRVGEIFLDWLDAPKGLRWLDVGCGNGAFTETIVARCAPSEAHGIDPSDAQIVHARSRAAGGGVQFHSGDAIALPLGVTAFVPPSAEVSRLENMQALWQAAGLDGMEARRIDIEVEFADFDDFWQSCTALPNPSVAYLRDLAPADVARVRAWLHENLPADASGRIRYGAFANAVKGQVPA